MHIHDLEIDVELDRAAMKRITGGVATAPASSFTLPTEPAHGIGGHGCGLFGGDIKALIESHIPAMPAMPEMPSAPTHPAQPEPIMFQHAGPATSSY